MTALRCRMKEACAEGSASYSRVSILAGAFYEVAPARKAYAIREGVFMTPRRHRTPSSRLLIALAALFAFALAIPGCSTRNDSLPALGSEEDYLARRGNTTDPYGYAPYDLCAAYDPYCFTPYWSSVPIYYFSRRDGDHDCDGDRCRGPDNGFHRQLGSLSLHKFGATAPPAQLAHFGPLLVGGGFRGHSHR
jgi:hypothetical protein